LLQRYNAAPKRTRKGDWIFIFAVLGLLFIIVFAGLFVSFLVLQAIVRLFSGN
jgi:hypothetical protein